MVQISSRREREKPFEKRTRKQRESIAHIRKAARKRKQDPSGV
jgi:hypothetical protein